MMGDEASDNPANGDLRCPTCGARQEWSDVCRRCRCDLGLLRRVSLAARASRRRCLCALRAGRMAEALRHARRLQALCPDQPASRLLAVCHLLQGNWLAAALAAESAERRIEPLSSLSPTC